jgi:MscS family membrane protein
MCLVFLVWIGLCQPGFPQTLPEAVTPSESKDATSVDSPRAMVRQFLDVIRRDNIDSAFFYTEFPRPMGRERRRTLVRQLVNVLNKKAQIDLARISDDPAGRLDDGLLPDQEVIGKIEILGESIPVELKRIHVAEEERKVWRFAPEFMDKIPRLAEKLEEIDIENRLPPLLKDHAAFGIKAWQWLGLALAVLLAGVTSWVLAFLLVKVINFTTRRFKITLSDRALHSFVPSLRWLSGLAIFHVASSFLELKIELRQTLSYIETILFTWVFMFLGLRLVEAFIELARANLEKQGKGTAMLQPAQKGCKTVLVVIALIWMFRSLGFDVTAIVAGLGVGGLAIALAGQKTIENLFGGISVILDQPVRVGDSGRFGEVIGTVEDIGLRSTKVRTLDRTLVTIPNAEFSLMKLENFERRDKIRWAPTISVRYETTPDQLRLLLMRIKELLIGHPMVLNDPARVRFVRFGVHGLDIELFCFINSGDYNEYLAVVEDLNLKMMDLVSETGTAFALASSTVYVEQSRGVNPETREKALQEALEIRESTGFPQPHYPQTWIEPRIDRLSFGPSQPVRHTPQESP